MRLVVTVDMGSSSGAEIAAAAEAGIDVIVTDHHRVPPEPPPALALVNPHRVDSTYPDARLTGSGVALKIAALLLERLGGVPVRGDHAGSGRLRDDRDGGGCRAGAGREPGDRAPGPRQDSGRRPAGDRGAPCRGRLSRLPTRRSRRSGSPSRPASTPPAGSGTRTLPPRSCSRMIQWRRPRAPPRSTSRTWRDGMPRVRRWTRRARSWTPRAARAAGRSSSAARGPSGSSASWRAARRGLRPAGGGRHPGRGSPPRVVPGPRRLRPRRDAPGLRGPPGAPRRAPWRGRFRDRRAPLGRVRGALSRPARHRGPRRQRGARWRWTWPSRHATSTTPCCASWPRSSRPAPGTRRRSSAFTASP